MPKLISWTEHTDKGVKYFSGTAIYVKEIEILADRLGVDRSLWLNLGTVKNFAEVAVNGKPLGILWKPPFRVDITDAVKPGKTKSKSRSPTSGPTASSATNNWRKTANGVKTGN